MKILWTESQKDPKNQHVQLYRLCYQHLMMVNINFTVWFVVFDIKLSSCDKGIFKL